MARKLFCEISPFTYKISVRKNKTQRYFQLLTDGNKYAKEKSDELLAYSVYKHKSLIRRTLGNVDAKLQNNKAINLEIAAPKVTGILIKPGEVFSFWRLVGSCTEKKGYKEGLMIKGGAVDKGIGGGMCQFTNLIHWMIMHSPMEIIEHHHHNGIDMFPDFKRTIPFGTGTSIMHNYLDYRFKNITNQTFQMIISVDDTYLNGELRCEKPLNRSYHVVEEEHYFTKEGSELYRNNKVYRRIVDKETGNLLRKELMITNHAKVVYDHSFVDEKMIKER